MSANSLLVVAAYAAAVWSGYRLLALAYGNPTEERERLLGLAPGIGLGVVCLVLWVPLWFRGSLAPGVSLGVFAALCVCLGLTARGACSGSFNKSSRPSRAWLVLPVTALLVWTYLLKSPFGSGQDVWAIWKLKARFLYQGSAPWEAFAAPSLNFSHPDYPWFYPLSMSWGWIWAGRETIAAPWAIALLFSVSTVAVMMTGLYPYGRRVCAVGGLFLVSTPQWAGIAGSQYADVLIAYFNLCVAVLLARAVEKNHRPDWLLAGVFAGLAAFTKNEGWLSTVALLAAVVSGGGRSARLAPHAAGALGRVLTGALPVLLVTALSKGRIGVPSDVFNWREAVVNLLSGRSAERIPVVLGAVWTQIFEENTWVYSWFVIVLATAGSLRKILPSAPDRAVAVFCLVLAFGYGGVYLLTPIDVNWLLPASIDRLLLHLFPAASYLAFRNLRERTMP